MRWVLSHQHDPQALQLMITGKGGLVAYLGTNEFPEIERSAEGNGRLDRQLCDELIRSLCYQISKSIAALAAFTEGKVDAVVLTGGLAFSRRVVEDISRRRVVPRARAPVPRGERAGSACHGRARCAPRRGVRPNV